VFSLADKDISQVVKVFGHAEKMMLESRDNFKVVFSDLGVRVEHLTA